MIPRAVVFDVYGTLLELGPPSSPESLDQAWRNLHREFFRTDPAQPYEQFIADARDRIHREHAIARAQGIPHPEILWPDIATAALPALASLTGEHRDTCLRRLAGLPRSVRLASGAGKALLALQHRGILLGIASNAQAYTLPELDEALQTQGLQLELFPAFLRFWSFEQGFSKPDPHVFRILSARLGSLGVQPSETLMIGDRIDNDIEPARNAGWRTWHLHCDGDGDWHRLTDLIQSNPQPASP